MVGAGVLKLGMRGSDEATTPLLPLSTNQKIVAKKLLVAGC